MKPNVANLPKEKSNDQKCVVVFGTDHILYASIQQFLASKEKWKVVNIRDTGELDDFIQKADQVHADIFIIIDHEKQNGLSDMQLHFLQAQRQLKVVVINSEDNGIEIYHKQKILLKEATDLVSLIEEETYLSKEEERKGEIYRK